MVDVDGEVKIVDWGIARAKNRYVKTSAGNIKGKFRYMPPEQITNQAIGPYTDIYAAAVTFWELMAAKRIYDGSEVAHFMMKVANGEVPSLHEARPDVPKELEAIYRKATAKRPSDRYESALHFAEALREVPGRMRPVEAKSVLSTFPRDARIFETRRTYESAVARARDASASDLESALLRALEDPDRVERVDVDWESLSSAEKLRKQGPRAPSPRPES
jgi:serine/threonine protein kinase